jgi:hypothetical protein
MRRRAGLGPLFANPEEEGKRPTLTSRPCFLACVSVRPHRAISGSVNTSAGMAHLSGRRLT